MLALPCEIWESVHGTTMPHQWWIQDEQEVAQDLDEWKWKEKEE
jgi:hypothetical protein